MIIYSLTDGDLSHLFADYDRELRAASLCPTCCKPRRGVVPLGVSDADAGLCVEHYEEVDDER